MPWLLYSLLTLFTLERRFATSFCEVLRGAMLSMYINSLKAFASYSKLSGGFYTYHLDLRFCGHRSNGIIIPLASLPFVYFCSRLFFFRAVYVPDFSNARQLDFVGSPICASLSDNILRRPVYQSR